ERRKGGAEPELAGRQGERVGTVLELVGERQDGDVHRPEHHHRDGRGQGPPEEIEQLHGTLRRTVHRTGESAGRTGKGQIIGEGKTSLSRPGTNRIRSQGLLSACRGAGTPSDSLRLYARARVGQECPAASPPWQARRAQRQ